MEKRRARKALVSSEKLNRFRIRQDGKQRKAIKIMPLKTFRRRKAMNGDKIKKIREREGEMRMVAMIFTDWPVLTTS